MARNRKRAKERRARRPAGAAVGRAAGAELDAAPDPIQHAAPDVELAEAQLAVGRPELSEAVEPELEEPYESAPDEEETLGAAGGGRAARPGGSEVVPGGAGSPEPRPHPGNRLVNFAQGSWRELQRVQWPDRRQVMQATGVVIGFVIVAGAFLGVADFLAGKLMNYVLTGHFK